VRPIAGPTPRRSNSVAVKHRNPCMWMVASTRRGPGKTISSRTHMLRSTVRLHAMTTARQGNRRRAAHEASRVGDKSRIFRKAPRDTDPNARRAVALMRAHIDASLHHELQLTPQAACTRERLRTAQSAEPDGRPALRYRGRTAKNSWPCSRRWPPHLDGITVRSSPQDSSPTKSTRSGLVDELIAMTGFHHLR
jgi:hypothetical protein